MIRAAFLLKVRTDRLEEYRRIHQSVWPEMCQALRQAGWHNYSLFLRSDGLLFGYVETPHGLHPALSAMDRQTINDKWQRQMAPFFEIPPGARVDQGFLEQLEEIFHLD